MIRGFSLVVVAISFSVSAQEGRSVLAETVVLFGEDDPPAFLESSRGWMSVGNVNWNLEDIGASQDPRYRRWRLRNSL